jgi:hypothetical protein
VIRMHSDISSRECDMRMHAWMGRHALEITRASKEREHPLNISSVKRRQFRDLVPVSLRSLSSDVYEFISSHRLCRICFFPPLFS